MDGIGDFFSGIGDSIGSLFGGDSNAGSQVYSDPIGPQQPDSSGFSGFSGAPDLSGSQSFSNPLSIPSTPGIQTQPNNLGGQAAPSGMTTYGGTPPTSLSTGSYGIPSVSTSAGSDPLAALFNPQGTGGTVGPTASAGAAITGASPQPQNQDNSLLSLLGIGTGNGKLDQSLLGGAVSGGGLLANLLMGSPSASAEKSLKNIAGQQNAQGQQLESYLANGTLPPGAQQWVDQQSAGQKSAIRAKYAQLGMSGSTAESQELNNVDAQATSQMFTIASQLLNTGISETNASGTLYNYLMQAQNDDAKDVSAAIQNFVTSLAGGGGSPGTISLKVGQ